MVKKFRKIIIIELDLDIHKIHLRTPPSFSPIFRLQVIIWKPTILLIQSTKRGITLVRIVQNRHDRTRPKYS